MRKNVYASFLLALMIVASVSGQTRHNATANRPAPRPANQVVPLPASDVVMFVDVRRLLTEALPRAFASDPTKLAEINADVEQFKTRTGIDARAFDRVAVGARFTNPSERITKIDHVVAVANGTFNAGALVAAGRLAAKGNYRELKHEGRTVYIFSLNEQVKLFGLLNMRVRDLAMTVLDANTLAVGEPEAVRAAISASAGRGRVSPEMVTLARRNPNAIIGFGGNLPASLTRNLDLGNQEITRSIASIRQFYGSVGTTAVGFDMLTVLRTSNADDARNLSDTIAAVKQLAPLLLGRLSGDKGKLAQSAINSLQVSTQGNEVQLRLELAQADLAALIRVF